MEITRWVFSADLHGDQGHAPTLIGLRKFMDKFEPHEIIFGGDLWNFDALREKANARDKSADAQSDIDAGFAFLDWYKPTVFMCGNHDERIFKAASNGSDGVLRAFGAGLIERMLERFENTKHFRYHKRNGLYRLGDTYFAHGYKHGKTAVLKMAEIYGSIVFGHIHREGHMIAPGIPPKHGHTVGCLCNVDMEYNAADAESLAKTNGWAYGWVIDGRTVVWKPKLIGGKWWAPTELEAFEAIDPSSGELTPPGSTRSATTSPTPKSSAARSATASRKPCGTGAGARRR